MRIVTVRHKGLKQLLEDNNSAGLRQDFLPRVRRILTALISADTVAEVHGPPGWRIHQLGGDRAGTWSITVSSNWRITFRVKDDAILDLDLEDYH